MDEDVTILKRGDFFIRAAKIVCERFVGTTFVIIGHKGNAFVRLKAMVDELNLTDNFVFTGALPNFQVVDWLRKSKIYTQISDTETFGVAVAEAMATGTPVIVSRCGALPALVDNTGIYVDHNSVDSIASGIQEMLSTNDATLRSYGLMARARIVDNFNYEKRKSAIRKLIESLPHK